ncbi:MAG: succinoglycan biosynthesis protein exop [Rhizobiaceae bacterium]|nr:MAG: succinoglycan biosynthesis protein exop [Rhizobiaceae bacterium]CAG0952229.1 hypothetical protein RHIZO_00251 [Rhizobiaceae bacterium]
MAQYETNGDGKRAQSLLAHAPSPRTGSRSNVGNSLLNSATEEDLGDAATRHRLARSRREAAKSPLMNALSKPADGREAGTAVPLPPDPSIAGEDKIVPAAARGLRSMLRDRLFGREMPKDAVTSVSAAANDSAPRDERRESPIPAGMWSPRPHVDELPPVAAMPVPRDPAAWRPLIDPIKVISGIANSKLLIVSLTIAGAVLGVVVALSTPKKYESVAEMLVDPRDLRLTDREITTTGLPSDATLAIVENQVRVLTSGTVLNRVVDELNLTSDPEFNGEAENGLFSTLANWRALFQRSSGDDGGVRKRAITIDNLARSLNVERGGKTFVVSVGVTTESPDKSALIANTMTRVFLETYGKFQSNTAGRAADELNSRLDELRREVEEAERKVETFKAENDLIGSQGRLISEDDIVSLNTQLSVARARTLELNAKAASARTATAEAALSGALPEELTSNVMTELRSQYAALKSEADRLSARLGPRHPQRQAIDAQLEGARGQIEGELRRIVSSIQVELRRAVQLEQELASRLAQLKVGQGNVNADLVTLRELEREATAKRAVYESFLLRAKETGEQRDINAANISVISQAFPPIVSVGPSRAITVLTFMIAGFVGGVGIGGARGAWRSLRDDSQARSRTDAFGDTGDPAPEPNGGGPDEGPRGGRPDRTAGDQEPLKKMTERPYRSPAPAQTNPAMQRGEAMETKRSSWLGAFRRKLKQDEAAQDPAVASTAGVPLPQTAAGVTSFEAAQTPNAIQSATWHPVHPAPSPQPTHAWQAGAQVPPQPVQAYPQPMPGFPQSVPLFPQPAHAYPLAAAPYPQPMALYPQAAPVALPVSFTAPAQQPAPAFVAHQPMAIAGYHPAQPAYPYPVHSAVTQPPLMPLQPALVAQPTQAYSARWDDDLISGERDSRDRGPSARTVEELRHDLREFREAVLDLAESRTRRRYA